jgi:hypothetical protein
MNVCSSPRVFKDKIFKIRRVLQMVNQSFKFKNGYDPAGTPVDLKELQADYISAATQFFKGDIQDFKDDSQNDDEFNPSDLHDLQFRFHHVSYLDNRKTPVACHISAEAFDEARIRLF